MKKLLCVVFSLLIALTFAAEEKEFDLMDIFESESDFMKGFETGILLRTKQGNIADFGCKLPDSLEPNSVKAFDTFKQIFAALKLMGNQFGQNTTATGIIEMVESFIFNFIELIQVMLIPDGSPDAPDMYCKGMFFGLNGSKMMVQIANQMLKGVNFGSMKFDRPANPNGVPSEKTKKKKEQLKQGMDMFKTILTGA